MTAVFICRLIFSFNSICSELLPVLIIVLLILCVLLFAITSIILTLRTVSPVLHFLIAQILSPSPHCFHGLVELTHPSSCSATGEEFQDFNLTWGLSQPHPVQGAPTLFSYFDSWDSAALFDSSPNQRNPSIFVWKMWTNTFQESDPIPPFECRVFP